MTHIQKGTLLVKYDTQKLTEKFSKREFVLEIGEQYKEYPKFQLINDKCNLLDSFIVGQELTVYFNLKGKPFQNKQGETTYFTNLDAWKIESDNAPSNVPPPTQKDEPPQTVHADLPPDNADDLPF